MYRYEHDNDESAKGRPRNEAGAAAETVCVCVHTEMGQVASGAAARAYMLSARNGPGKNEVSRHGFLARWDRR